MYNRELARYAKNKNVASYRNTRLNMAQFLVLENRKKPALDTLLEICHIDINGSENFDIDDRKKFIPQNVYLAPYVINTIVKLSDALQFKNEQLKQIFTESCKNLEHFKFSIDPMHAWTFVEKELQDQKN